MAEKKYPNQMAQKKKNHRVRKTRLSKIAQDKEMDPKGSQEKGLNFKLAQVN